MFNKLIFLSLSAVFCQLTRQLAIGGNGGNGTPDYDGCGTLYYCFGLPDKCVDRKSCITLLKTDSSESGLVDFRLFWIREAEDYRYVAAALSTDQKMGDDSTTLLWIDTNGTVNTAEGLTFLKNEGGKEQGGFNEYPVDGIKMLEHEYKDGLLTAHWTREANTSVNKETFDLKATKYYILLAYGQMAGSKYFNMFLLFPLLFPLNQC